MTKHSSPLIDEVLRLAKDYDFPTEVQCDEYRDTQRQADVIQIYFRYHPFDNRPEKFACEIAITDSSQSNPKMTKLHKKEIEDRLRKLENMWKSKFTYIFYRGVPYSNEVDGDTYKLKCELCDEVVNFTQDDDIQKKQDLYTIVGLKEIDCDCDDGWDSPGVDENLQVEEGDTIPRSTV